jgi:four helix bundle protein
MMNDECQQERVTHMTARHANKDLRERTKAFALRIVRMVSALPHSLVAHTIGGQILRSGTSIGAQYREACRSRSVAEFISKMESALQELDETAYWLELLADSGAIPPKRLVDLRQETEELIAIFTASVKTAKRNKQ